jgi:hypothetical protein
MLVGGAILGLGVVVDVGKGRIVLTEMGITGCVGGEVGVLVLAGSGVDVGATTGGWLFVGFGGRGA